MTRHDDSEQLAWDFDAPEMDGGAAGTSTPVAADGGVASYAPGSERWIAALQATDADAMRLDRLDVSSMSAEAAARLWARVAAWVESDQIAYYIDDAPVSSDAGLRCENALPAGFGGAVSIPRFYAIADASCWGHLLQRFRIGASPVTHDES